MGVGLSEGRSEHLLESPLLRTPSENPSEDTLFESKTMVKNEFACHLDPEASK